MKRILTFAVGSFVALIFATSCSLSSDKPELDQIVAKNMWVSTQTNHVRNVNAAQDMAKGIVNQVPDRDTKLIVLGSDEITKKTTEILDYLEGLKKEVIDQSGGINGQGMLVNQSNTEAVSSVLVKNENIQKSLNSYVDYLNQHAPQTPPHKYFALNGKEDIHFDNSSDFNKNYFNGLSASDALSIIAYLQMKVVLYETEVITQLENLL